MDCDWLAVEVAGASGLPFDGGLRFNTAGRGRKFVCVVVLVGDLGAGKTAFVQGEVSSGSVKSGLVGWARLAKGLTTGG